MKTVKLITQLVLFSFLISGCEDDIEGHKIININFTNALTGVGIDSIHCFIGKPGFPYYRTESETLSDKNGNCRLETDFYSSSRSYFVISEDLDMTFDSQKLFTYRGNDATNKYRLKGNKPYINLGKNTEFKLNFQLIPLTKIVISCEFKKELQGYRNYEFFEKGESIYKLSRGSRYINDKWLVIDKDTDICYVNSTSETKLVYSIKNSANESVYSKAVTIDSVAIRNKTLHVVYD